MHTFFEKLEQTMECISSFLPSGVAIHVLNNGSSQPARRGLQEFCATHGEVTIIDSEINLGVGVGRNRIISESAEEWLLFVDNDITMRTPDWVESDFSGAFPRLISDLLCEMIHGQLFIADDNQNPKEPAKGRTDRQLL